jgi:hypothetical protein
MMLGGGFGPGARIIAFHLGPVATRASYVFGRIREARVAVEAPPRPQTDEDLARISLQPLLELHGIVTRIEDEQGTSVDPSFVGPAAS